MTHVYDGRALTITFADPVPAGETRTVSVRYAATRPITGLLFSDAPAFIASDHETQRARHWIPCVDHPAVRTTLDVTITGPAAWHLLGPGLLVHESTDGDRKTARWKLDQRCPAYLLCVALGDFARVDGGAHVRSDQGDDRLDGRQSRPAGCSTAGREMLSAQRAVWRQCLARRTRTGEPAR